MDEFSLGAWDPSTSTLPNMFDTSLAFGVAQVPQAPNTLFTVPSNALQSMAPVSNAGTESWSGFWQDLTKGVVGYAVTRDAVKNGISARQAPQGVGSAPQIQAQPRAQQAGIPVGLLLLAGVAFVALK